MVVSYQEQLSLHRLRLIKNFRSFVASLQEEKTDIYSSQYIHTQLIRHLELLGHPDSDIRDELVSKNLDLYFESQSFPNDERIFVLDILFNSEFLFQQIQSSSVEIALKRSFSALVIASIIRGDMAGSLDNKDLITYGHKVTRYLLEEKIILSKHENYGRVHSIAHAADLIGSILAHSSCDEELAVILIEAIFQAIKSHKDYVYAGDEHYRLSIPLAIALHKFPHSILDICKIHFDLNSHDYRLNLKNTFRCLYIESALNIPVCEKVKTYLSSVFKR